MDSLRGEAAADPVVFAGAESDAATWTDVAPRTGQSRADVPSVADAQPDQAATSHLPAPATEPIPVFAPAVAREGAAVSIPTPSGPVPVFAPTPPPVSLSERILETPRTTPPRATTPVRAVTPSMPTQPPAAAPSSQPARPAAGGGIHTPFARPSHLVPSSGAPPAPIAPRPSFMAPPVVPASRPSAASSPGLPTPTASAAIPRPSVAAPAGPSRAPINPFLANDPNAKAKRLARALVSDIVVYFPQKRDEGIRDGTLKQLFREEIKKSYEEYVDQIGREFAEGTTHFQDALNDVLAGGKKLF
ncbi:MAG: hypothetical protein ABJE47_18205 [bacterium]